MRYRVKLPWFGVKVGQIIETDNLHSALLPNVEVAIGEEGSVVVDGPDGDATRGLVIAKLKELNIDHDENVETHELAALLPEEELNAILAG